MRSGGLWDADERPADGRRTRFRASQETRRFPMQADQGLSARVAMPRDYRGLYLGLTSGCLPLASCRAGA
jgi:hypothetical protein